MDWQETSGVADVVAAVVWLLATGLLVTAAAVWGRRVFPEDGVAAQIVHVGVLCWSVLVAVALLLGVCGVLTAPTLLGTVAGGSVAALAVWRRTNNRKPSVERTTSRQNDVGRARRWLPIAADVVWGGLASLFAARVVLDGLLRLPSDWDTLAYHLPLVNHWLREGVLYVPDCAFWYVPGNAELLTLWLVAPFSGDFLVSLSNALPLALLAAAALELCRRLCVAEPLCHAAALAIVVTGPSLRQIVSAENDLAVAGLYLATLLYGVRYWQSARRADLVWASLAFGLLAGIKYYALGYAAVAGLALLLLLLLSGRKRDAANALAAGLLGAAALGAYWYARNAWWTGTPLFPLGFVGESDVWRQMRPASHTSMLLYSGRREVWPLLWEAISGQAGPVHLVSVTLLPCAFMVLAVSVWMTALPRERIVRLMLLIVISLSIVVFLHTPNVVETQLGMLNMLKSKYHPVRLGLCTFSIAVLGLAVVTSDVLTAVRSKWAAVGRKLGRAHLWRAVVLQWLAVGIVLLLWTILTAWQVIGQIVRHVTLDIALLALNMALAGLLVYLVATTPGRVGRLIAAVGAMVIVGLLVWGSRAIAVRWHDQFTSHFDARQGNGVFEELFRFDQQDERICVCDYRYYPFLGSHRQFDVCRPLWLPDKAFFFRYLDEQHCTLTVINSSGLDTQGRYVGAPHWIAAHADVFVLLIESRRYRVFRIDRARLKAALAKLRSAQLAV